MHRPKITPAMPDSWSPRVFDLHFHNKAVDVAVCSPDGLLIASADRDSTVVLWDARTGTETGRKQSAGKGVVALVFSTDGRTLAIGSSSSFIELIDVASSEGLSTRKLPPGRLAAFAFSADGRMTAAMYDNRTDIMSLWDVDSLEKLHESEDFLYAGNERFSSTTHLVAFSSPSREVVVIWDIVKREIKAQLDCHGKYVMGINFSWDGSVIAAHAFRYGTILFNTETGNEICTIPQSGPVFARALSTDGNKLATTDRYHRTQVWDVSKRKEICSPIHGYGPVHFLLFSSIQPVLFLFLSRTIVAHWYQDQEHTLRNDDTYSSGGCLVAVSPDGVTAATTSAASVQLWDTRGAVKMKRLEGHEKAVTTLVFAADGLTLATGSYDCTVRIWSVKNGNELKRYHGKAGIVTLSLSFTGDAVACLTHTKLYLWRTDDDNLLCERQIYAEMSSRVGRFNVILVGELGRLADSEALKEAEKLFESQEYPLWLSSRSRWTTKYRSPMEIIISERGEDKRQHQIYNKVNRPNVEIRDSWIRRHGQKVIRLPEEYSVESYSTASRGDRLVIVPPNGEAIFFDFGEHEREMNE